MLRVDTDKFRHSIEEPNAIDNVRVSICVQDESSCGKNINANIGTSLNNLLMSRPSICLILEDFFTPYHGSLYDV